MVCDRVIKDQSSPERKAQSGSKCRAVTWEMEVEGTIASAAPTQISAHLVCLLSLCCLILH